MVYSTDQINRILQDYVNKTLVYAPDVEEVWLFGSYSNGTPNEESDIDLAVVSERFVKDLPQAMVDFYEAVWDANADVTIQIHGFTHEEFAGSADVLAQEVKRTGKRVYPIQ